MSYQVLARKWRPQNFKELVGQNHIRTALSNALDNNRLHHAYLFTGTRGVGKTTIARILAKCLNCETGITSNPCGECHSCRDVAANRFIDLIEVDAASRTKVEDTRELLDNVQYAPTQGRFKVYLIDEVHMLSKHSFNALLKTLEEPPEHVKFLLATTDPQKLPATVLSRCLQFNLKRMTLDTIQTHLAFLLQQETIESNPLALKHIAQAADGSMRDALSLLDQAIVFGAGSVQENTVRDMLGGVAHEPLIALLETVVQGQGEALLAAVEALSSCTPDYEIAADSLIHLLHQISVIQLIPNIEPDDELSRLAQIISPEDAQLFYQIALYGRRDLSLSPDPRIGFEMIALRMLAFRPVDMQHIADFPVSKKKNLTPPEHTTDKKLVNIDQPAKALSQNIPIQPKLEEPPPHILATEQDPVTLYAAFSPPEIKQDEPLSTTVDRCPVQVQAQPENSWHKIVSALNLRGMGAELARHCFLAAQTEQRIELSLATSNESLCNPATEAELHQALEQYFSKTIKLVITLYTSTEQGDTIETPAKKALREAKENQANIEQAIYNDPFVKQLQSQFNAEIIVNSIQPIAPSGKGD